VDLDRLAPATLAPPGTRARPYGPSLYSAAIAVKDREVPLSVQLGRLRPIAALLLAGLVAVLVSACGGSSGSSDGSASSLLRQTFSGSHKVDSGQLSFAVTLTPAGSSTLNQPVSISFGGPFQSRGTGQLPASDFAVSGSLQGHHGALSIISTGTQGFVTVSGTSYQLPTTTFQQLESSFSSIAASGGSSKARSGTLSRLGINPLGWLTQPTIVGQDSVGGTQTTHIRAQVNVRALLRDLNTFLQKAGSLGVPTGGSVPTSLSASEQAKIASEVQHPNFDVWTGNTDKTVRRLTVGLTVPVSGQISTLLGGLKTAAIELSLQYTDLNQPQSITAPTKLRPYSEFSTRIAGLVQGIEGALAAGAAGGASSSGGSAPGGSPGSGSSSGALSSGSDPYTQCISAAGNDISKMQKCASLLSGSGG
jgi:hypothetical protein